MEENNKDKQIKLGTNEDIVTEDIIVIEDEIISSALLEKYLAHLPEQKELYGIEIAQNDFKLKFYKSGWPLLNKDLSKVKIAIVDMLIPQINGVDLIKDFRRRYPKMGILPMSGMATDAMKRKLQELLPENIKLVDKPIRKEAFYQALANAVKHFEEYKEDANSIDHTDTKESVWTEVSNTSSNVLTLHRSKIKKAA